MFAPPSVRRSFFKCAPPLTWNPESAPENMLSSLFNRIGGVMISVFATSAVDRGFEHLSDQTKENKIGICWFSTKHAAFTS